MSTAISRWNPNKVARRVRLQEIVDGEVAVFATKSFTDPAGDDRYHPMVDIPTGSVSCDCKSFQCRHARRQPTVYDTGHHCKHVSRAIETLRRRELLPPLALVPHETCGGTGVLHDLDLSVRRCWGCRGTGTVYPGERK